MSETVKYRLQPFLDELASDSPTPGGACGAAATGSIAAALLVMVCRVTAGKRGYEDVQEEIARALERCQALQTQLLAAGRSDEEAYQGLIAAFKLPRATEAQRQARNVALGSAWKEAVHSPLNIARLCLAVLKEATGLLPLGNRNAASDAAVAAILAESGLRASAHTTRSNLSGLSERSEAASVTEELDRMEDQGQCELMALLNGTETGKKAK